MFAGEKHLATRLRKAVSQTVELRFQQKSGEIVFMWKAILTDSHFWVPMVVLVFGIALLAYLR
jgi:hypothetical protein